MCRNSCVIAFECAAVLSPSGVKWKNILLRCGSFDPEILQMGLLKKSSLRPRAGSFNLAPLTLHIVEATCLTFKI